MRTNGKHLESAKLAEAIKNCPWKDLKFIIDNYLLLKESIEMRVIVFAKYDIPLPPIPTLNEEMLKETVNEKSNGLKLNINPLTDETLKKIFMKYNEFQSVLLSRCRELKWDWVGELPGVLPTKKLCLGGSNAPQQICILLRKLPYLEYLCLRNVGINDEAMEIIAACTELKSLRLVKCSSITDQGLSHLRRLPNLETLKITSCFGITNAGVEFIKQYPKLTQVCLSGCYITDECLTDLLEGTSIKEICLCDTSVSKGLKERLTERVYVKKSRFDGGQISNMAHSI
ncbi:F-box/LRR-repeat protein [Acrasis kona]|uniref:F-box/LRR-repeat protein n=1 Tax=Acrasis kona TaxID=1008807 RepID=A0AAW2ZI07_9EUKA